jgi:GT2 family glycosyltransferase
MTLNCAFIIATRNRSLELTRLLRSVQAQEVHPARIIIIDASDAPCASLFSSEAFSPLSIGYQKAVRACLPAQRNQGIALLGADVELVCFLDDDIVFRDGALKAMAAFWQGAAADIGGAVFNIVNEKRPTGGTFFKTVFMTGSSRRGVVLMSGYNTLMCPAEQDMDAQWLFGGATVWRRNIFREFLFDEWFEGTGLCEDLDFSYRVGRKYRLMVVAGAQVDHLCGTVGRRRNAWFGHSQVTNRFYFVCKNRLSIVMFLWGTLGQMLENGVMGIITRDRGYFLRLWGNVTGLVDLKVLGQAVKARREDRLCS